jgi:trans-AT polyketide synthase/acyltransferase/oxidoreductase domain-containing protein
MADDVCAVGDCAGYTEMGVLSALLPAILRMRADLAPHIRVGAGGGIGTPGAVAAAFVLGADFVLTGSINLATVESALPDRTKDLLTDVDVHDTTYAPSADLFELGGRARVLRKGTLFHARSAKLHDLWRANASWEHIDPSVRDQVERKYFQATFAEMAAGFREPDPKRLMALVFRAYCERAERFAVTGAAGREADYAIACGPALGASNHWLRGTELASWRSRHVDELAVRLMTEAAQLVSQWV